MKIVFELFFMQHSNKYFIIALPRNVPGQVSNGAIKSTCTSTLNWLKRHFSADFNSLQKMGTNERSF